MSDKKKQGEKQGNDDSPFSIGSGGGPLEGIFAGQEQHKTAPEDNNEFTLPEDSWRKIKQKK